jgi:hypothetical protein
LFTVKTADRWIQQAKTRPIPKMLFSEFWFEGELCILFADTNLGKSILAVQIGNSVSKGEPIYGFKLETTKQPILYFDFELNDKQQERFDQWKSHIKALHGEYGQFTWKYTSNGIGPEISVYSHLVKIERKISKLPR